MSLAELVITSVEIERRSRSELARDYNIYRTSAGRLATSLRWSCPVIALLTHAISRQERGSGTRQRRSRCFGLVLPDVRVDPGAAI